MNANKNMNPDSSPRYKASIESFPNTFSFPDPEQEKEKLALKRWEELIFQENHIHPRSYHTSIIYENYLYVYGGYEITKGILSDFCKLNLESNEIGWEKIEKPKSDPDWIDYPGPLHRHSCVFYKEKMYIYGGKRLIFENSENIFSFSFKENKWEKIISKKHEILPFCIDSHSAAIYQDEMIVFGGFVGSQVARYSNCIYSYNFSTNEWKFYFFPDSESMQYKTPKRRANAGSVIYQDSLYIFGGTNGKSKMNDLWQFNLQTKKWNIITSTENIYPEARSGHIFLLNKDKLILFGGIHDIAHEKNDVLYFDLSKNCWLKIEEDSTRYLFDKKTDSKDKRNKKPQTEINNDKKAINPIFLQISPKRAKRNLKSVLFIRNQKRNRSLMSPSKRSDMSIVNSCEPKSPIQLKEERLKKEKYLKKIIMLSEFEVTEDIKYKLMTHSPTTEAMKNTIIAIKNDIKFNNSSNNNQNPNINNSKNQFFISEDKKCSLIKGKKPCARDGATGNIYKNKIIIFGGDRHLMTFHDLYFLNLDQT